MALTVRDLLTDSLKDLGAIGVGEQLSDEEAQDALGALNDLIGTWSTESLLVYSMAPTVLTYPSFQQHYTIGIGGDFNVPRPLAIGTAYNRDANDNDYAIYVTKDYQDYSDLVTKYTTSNLVTALYYNPGFPLGDIYVWPVPNDASYRLVLWTWGTVTEYATINDEVVLPPGYRRALRSNLAVELGPRYGKAITPALAAIAVSSKAQLKKYNLVPPKMAFPGDLTGAGLTFNYLSGQPY